MQAVPAALLEAAGVAEARTELTAAAAELTAARLGVAEVIMLDAAREDEDAAATGADEVEV